MRYMEKIPFPLRAAPRSRRQAVAAELVAFPLRTAARSMSRRLAMASPLTPRVTITVTDSTLKAKSTDTVAVYIWNSPDALTLTNSTVEASSEKSYALYAGSDGIEMSGGKVTLSTPASYATYTPGGLIAKDGVELNVTNSAHGLAANDTVRLSGATGTISVGNAALYSNSSECGHRKRVRPRACRADDN